MALGILSARRLGVATLAHASSSHLCCRPVLVRGHAMMKRKAVLSDKGAAPAASPPKPPLSASESASADTKGKGSEKGKASEKGSGKAAAASAKASEKPKLSVEEQNLQSLAEIDRIRAFQHLMPTIDPWGMAITDTLGACALFLSRFFPARVPSGDDDELTL